MRDDRQSTTPPAIAVGIARLIAAVLLGACGFSARASEVVADATGVTDDAGVIDDAATPGGDAGEGDVPGAPDAPLASIDLVETRSDVVAPGSSVVCYAPGAQSTRDGTWYRLFRLADFGVAGAFQVTGVSFASNRAQGARGIAIRVGTHAGAVGGTMISASAISVIATVSVDVPDDEQPQQVSVPIAARVPGGVLVVEVAAPSLQGAGHFNLGATTSGETAPGYFSSAACSISPPTSTTELGGTGQLVIRATGFAIWP